MKQATPQSQEHIVIKNLKDNEAGTLMYAKKYDSAEKKLSQISVQMFDEQGNLAQVENADEAEWNGQYWIMHKGTIYDLSGGQGVERTMHFTQQILPISQDPDKLANAQRKADEMSIRELRQQIKAYKAAYTNTNKLEMEMYKRFTIPLASFVFALVGAPLGIQKTRSSSSMGFAFSIVIIFIYYGVMTLAGALGEAGTIPTLLAAWLPNILGIIAGAYLKYRVSKELIYTSSYRLEHVSVLHRSAFTSSI